MWFTITAIVSLVVLVLYAGAAALGELPVQPINALLVTVPALATGITLVTWRQAQQRVDIVADLRVEFVGLARRVEDTTQPLPRAVGTAYIGGGFQHAREAGIIEGYEQGINAAPPEGGGTVLRMTDHRR